MRMGKVKCFLIIILYVITSNSKAQQPANLSNIDKITYSQYMKKDWDNLIKTGEKAIKNGVEFYYLDYRIGIAWYAKHNFTKAIKYLKKVYKSSPNDVFVKTYLYYAYLQTNRFDDARLLSYTFDDKDKETLHIPLKNPFIKFTQASYTTSRIGNYSYYSQNTNDNIEQLVIKNNTVFNFLWGHYIGNRTTLSFSYTKVNQDLEIRPIENNSLLQHLSQPEFYTSLKYHIAYGYSIFAGIHFLKTTISTPVQKENRNSSNIIFRDNATSYSAGITKDFPFFTSTLEASMSNLNLKKQLQPTLTLQFYPLGNNKFYLATKGIYIQEKDANHTNEYYAIKQGLTFRIKHYSFINPSITIGSFKNYTDYNAYIVNNNPDKTKINFENTINIGLKKGKINLFFYYQYNIKENTFEINNIEKRKTYTEQNFLFGINWIF